MAQFRGCSELLGALAQGLKDFDASDIYHILALHYPAGASFPPRDQFPRQLAYSEGRKAVLAIYQTNRRLIWSNQFV